MCFEQINQKRKKQIAQPPKLELKTQFMFLMIPTNIQTEEVTNFYRKYECLSWWLELKKIFPLMFSMVYIGTICKGNLSDPNQCSGMGV